LKHWWRLGVCRLTCSWRSRQSRRSTKYWQVKTGWSPNSNAKSHSFYAFTHNC
jgi:hypothetical protein